MRCWNRLPSEAVDASSPAGIQGQAGWDFEQPDLVVGVPAHSRVFIEILELDILKVSSNPNHSNLWLAVFALITLSEQW